MKDTDAGGMYDGGNFNGGWWFLEGRLWGEWGGSECWMRCLWRREGLWKVMEHSGHCKEAITSAAAASVAIELCGGESLVWLVRLKCWCCCRFFWCWFC